MPVMFSFVRSTIIQHGHGSVVHKCNIFALRNPFTLIPTKWPIDEVYSFLHTIGDKKDTQSNTRKGYILTHASGGNLEDGQNEKQIFMTQHSIGPLY